MRARFEIGLPRRSGLLLGHDVLSAAVAPANAHAQGGLRQEKDASAPPAPPTDRTALQSPPELHDLWCVVVSMGSPLAHALCVHLRAPQTVQSLLTECLMRQCLPMQCKP